MRIKNTSTSVVVVSDLPVGLSLPPGAEIVLFNEDVEKSHQIGTHIDGGFLIILDLREEPGEGDSQTEANPTFIGGHVMVVSGPPPTPGQLLAAVDVDHAQFQTGSGSQGPQGPQGVRGFQGFQGVGVQGAQGPQGAQGFGAQGATGATGVQGSQGAQGAQGVQGPFGGPQGPQGAQGSLGPQGAFGGPQGTQGPQGVRGFQGYQGSAGLPGIPGGDGPQGVGGPQGVQGPQGPSGGPQGAQGATGAGGPQGEGGPQGAQGSTGAGGAQGAQGAQGAEGSSAWHKYTLGFADFSDPSNSKSVVPVYLPGGAVITGIKIKHEVAFSGGSAAGVTIGVGNATDHVKFASDFDVFSAPSGGNAQLSLNLSMEDQTLPTPVTVTATSTGDTLDHITAGSVDVWVAWSKAD